MNVKKNIAVCNSSENTSGKISPIRNCKHQITPLKEKSKTSKYDQGSDVHTTSSTPDSQNSRFLNEFRSPSNSMSFSQDSRPEVTWDYTSPKLPKGARRKDFTMTVDEFLKNMYQDQVPESSKNGSHYIQLLEKWMNTNVTALEKQPLEIKKREIGKKKPRRFIEDMKQFLESIQLNKGISGKEGSMSPRVIFNGNNTNPDDNLNEKSFIWGDDEFDSTDEIWSGVLDPDTIIVKATQELESCSVKSNNEKLFLSPSTTLVYSIPETMSPNSSANSKCSTATSNKCSTYSNTNTHTIESNSKINKEDSFSDIEWDVAFEGCDDDDWDSEFLIGDESLSTIPDEVLQGVDLTQPVFVAKSATSTDATSKKKPRNFRGQNQTMTSHDSKVNFGDGLSQIKVHYQHSDINRISNDNKKVHKEECPKVELSFEKCDNDNSFELFIGLDDEDLLCKPEVLNLVDEVETHLSQDLKCTPEEIKQKKEEALKRRQKRLKNKQ